MKTREFIRVRDVARENGWDIVQESADLTITATFTKQVEKPFGDPVTRTVVVNFTFDQEDTIVNKCWYNEREIRWSQVRNALEHL